MATLQNLRNKAGILLAAVIFIALASFILGDLLKSGNSLIRGKQMEIARIDGESIEYPEFQASFDEVSKIYKSNNQTKNLDDKAYQQILNQTWETMVQDKIMSKVYDELGIDASKTLITGQDAEPQAIKNIVSGRQTITVFKPLKVLAENAVDVAIKLIKNQKIDYSVKINNNRIDVPTILFDPIVVDKSNIKETVVKEGMMKESEIYGK